MKAGEFYIENVLRGKGAEKKAKRLASQEMAAGSTQIEANLST